MSKNEQNNGLYIVIIILIWVIMGGAWYLYGQQKSWTTVESETNTEVIVDNNTGEY